MVEPWLKVAFLISLIVFIFLVFKFYWVVHVNYNKGLFSLYTPDNFHISDEHVPLFKRRVANGKRIAKNSKIIVTTLVRDVSHNMDHIQKKVNGIVSHFADYRILIVENDSHDDTREKLLKWANRDKRVQILGCGVNAKKCNMSFQKTVGHSVDRKRIEKMAILRNIYLDEIKNNPLYRDFDYTFMWDLDVIGMTYLDGVYNSLSIMNENPNIDTVCANGVYQWPISTVFYDTYAILEKDDHFHIDNKAMHDIVKSLKFKYFLGEEPIDVESCFSGFAIYRTKCLLAPNVYYDMTPDPNNIECEHTRLNKKISGKKIVNPSMINLIVLNV